MLTLKWELKDPKSCSGCQMYYIRFSKDYKDNAVHHCELNYYGSVAFNYSRTGMRNKTRPQRCIDELGE